MTGTDKVDVALTLQRADPKPIPSRHTPQDDLRSAGAEQAGGAMTDWTDNANDCRARRRCHQAEPAQGSTEAAVTESSVCASSSSRNSRTTGPAGSSRGTWLRSRYTLPMPTPSLSLRYTGSHATRA